MLARVRSTGVVPWALAAATAILPLVAGPPIADALHDLSVPVRTTASVGLWCAWGVGLLSTVVPHPVALTTTRVLAPAAIAATTLLRGDGNGWIASAVVAIVAAALAFAPAIGMRAVNGLAYPNERRFPLRPPGAVLLGPIVVAWALALSGVAAGPLLLAARVWVAGAVATVSGFGLAAILLRALHGLSRRWLVFVPAGVVLHDLLALSDPVLFLRPNVSRFGPAPADTDGLDLTERAPGLALELALREAADIGLARNRRVKADAVLFTPTRPGAVLDEAQRRRLPVR